MLATMTDPQTGASHDFFGMLGQVVATDVGKAMLEPLAITLSGVRVDALAQK